MDLDGGGGGGIEQSFLRQFSCMGTTDKDELVRQLQKLLGSHLNYSTAAFFLDMNNWNLQAAICSYLDVESSPTELPSMSLFSNPIQVPENETIEPGVSFHKTWHITNDGKERWPFGCYAKCAAGDRLNAPETVQVPCLGPNESAHLTIEMSGPQTPGIHQSKWRLCTPNGSYFGDPMWCIVTVEEESTIALTNQLSHFHVDKDDPGMC